MYGVVASALVYDSIGSGTPGRTIVCRTHRPVAGPRGIAAGPQGRAGAAVPLPQRRRCHLTLRRLAPPSIIRLVPKTIHPLSR